MRVIKTMKTRLFALTKGDIFRFPDEKTIYKANGFDISDENGLEVEYASFINEQRYLCKGNAAITEVELITNN